MYLMSLWLYVRSGLDLYTIPLFMTLLCMAVCVYVYVP